MRDDRTQGPNGQAQGVDAPPAPWRRHAAWGTATALAYGLICWVGLSIDVTSGAGSVWPASGLLLGILLLAPGPTVPAVLAGAMAGGVAANLGIGFPVATSLLYTAINLGEGLTGRTVLLRCCPDAIRLHRPLDVVALMGAGGVAAAGGGLMAAAVAHVTLSAEWLSVLTTWAGADAAGVAIVTPLVLAMATELRERSIGWSAGRVAEATALAVIVVGASWWVYFAKEPSRLDQFTNPIVLLPLIAWVAIRFETLGAAWCAAVINGLVIVATALGTGPVFDLEPQSLANVVVQARIGSTGLMVLAFGAAVSESRRLAGLHRRLSSEIQAARDAERGRLSHELHDDVAQKLAALKMRIELASMSGTAPDDTSRAIVDDLITTVRSLALEQRPAPFDAGQLAPALSALAGSARQRAGLSVRVDLADAESALPREVELACYRVAREALQNAVKHSGATRVHIAVRRLTDALTLTIADDGRGFDVEPTLRRAVFEGHLGLLGIRERMAGLGGTVTIGSRRGTGTTVECRLPLEQSVVEVARGTERGEALAGQGATTENTGSI